MSSMPPCVCRRCGWEYLPDLRNGYHQECCTRRACVLERKRARQRLWHRARYASEASFREKAKARVRRHRKRTSQAQAQGPPPSAAEGRVRHLEQALLGLAMQMGEESDAIRARELVSAWADSGSRRGAGIHSGP